MKLKQLFNTLLYLKPKQYLYQIKNRIIKVEYICYECPVGKQVLKMEPLIPKKITLVKDKFIFLNISSSFIAWNNISNGMLWTYNLNYMDWLLQEDLTIEEGIEWVDKFINDLPQNRIGLEPYPTALRGINWIKFISVHKTQISEEKLKIWNDSLYSQYKLLEKQLEYHLLGNHLLEDAYSLFIASIYFDDFKMYQRASRLLLNELKIQTLPDGAHYEQSPMYHCILLDRLLDCYNISINNDKFISQKRDIESLVNYCIKMLGHLKSILYKNTTFPIFNDTAIGVAPTPLQIFDYASRLGFVESYIPLKECGYRKMENSSMEAFVDIGNIMASYQPGHSHADTFNYELRINGKPFVVDTGISTYSKTSRRQYERSTDAHNCVVVDGKNSSEVWGGFRVGKRCKVTIINDCPNFIEAYHNGYKNKCYRTFKMDDNAFVIEDCYDGDAVSLIHLSSEADINKIKIEGAKNIEIFDTKYSVEYNRFIINQTIVIHFNGKMNYRISC